jgi:two-component system, OmpR family, response regulator ChvI
MDLRTEGDKNGVAVCLLDDDPSVLKATSRLLSSSGWTVESFTDPVAFLQYARKRRPSVAVIDIKMPTMDGLEVQRRLRTISPATRVIVLTGKDDPAVRTSAMNAGASDFFRKPITDGGLLAAIRSAASEN